MSYITGMVLGLLIGLFGRLAGFDRDRAFYPTVVIVTASYYVLFAVMGGSARTLVLESAPMVLFASMAVVGFRSSLWWIVAAFAAHGVFDIVHDRFVSNPGVPTFWPSFCLAIDVFLAVLLAWLLHSRIVRARRTETTSAVA
jgi:hypothetical protein